MYQPVVQLKDHTAAVNSLAFSPDGKMLAAASDDGTIILWE
jgi:WD40 repeat protein